jgi:TatD DNase family protein
MYVDSHAHLTGQAFATDLTETLQRAAGAGLEQILAIGCAPPGSLDCAIRIAEQNPWIHATLGIDPHQAKLATGEIFQEMARLARHPRVIAWGEIGLDYYYDLSPRDVQRRVFRRQLELAVEAGLPVSIHCRPTEGTENAWEELLQILRDAWVPSGIGGILHCFTGEWNHARAVLDFGFYISFSGIITYPKAQELRGTARRVPLDRLLIETDAPYLSPVPYRGKRNEPAHVVYTSVVLGSLFGRTGEEMGEITARNFYTLFPRVRRGGTENYVQKSD